MLLCVCVPNVVFSHEVVVYNPLLSVFNSLSVYCDTRQRRNVEWLWLARGCLDHLGMYSSLSCWTADLGSVLTFKSHCIRWIYGQEGPDPSSVLLL